MYTTDISFAIDNCEILTFKSGRKLKTLVSNYSGVNARARKEVPEPTLTFRKNLAMRMLRNKIQSNGLAAASPPRVRVHTSPVHMLRKWKTRDGKWNYSTRKFNKNHSDYVRYPCSDCKKPIRTYCSCNPGAPLCSICFGLHAQEHGH